MVKQVGQLWTNFKSQTFKGIATLIAAALIGSASTVLLGAWNSVKIPFDNKKEIEKVKIKNVQQDSILKFTVKTVDFDEYKKDRERDDEIIIEVLKDIKKKQDIIIESLINNKN